MPRIKNANQSAVPDAELFEDLVAENRILSIYGKLDAFGHVSVRIQSEYGGFLISRSMAPAQVTVSDVVLLDFHSQPVQPTTHKLYLERFIHSEIYRSTPVVHAIVHSHSLGLIPFGVTGTLLRPIFHMGGFLARGAPVFEIQDYGGDGTDMLIRTPELGAALASTLRGAPLALMRGHGSVVVGSSIREVVFRSIYADINARLQSEAQRLSPNHVRFLTTAEAVNADATNSGVIDRTWDLWRSQALPRRRRKSVGN